MDIGKIAYDAYCDQVGWVSPVTKSALPEYEKTPGDVQTAWLAAAMAVKNYWIPVGERMPESGVIVLAVYRNRLGNWRRVRAYWCKAKSVEACECLDIAVYDNETGTYYDPEGWYEALDNWDEYSGVAVVEGQVTHWMPLPDPPGYGAV